MPRIGAHQYSTIGGRLFFAPVVAGATNPVPLIDLGIVELETSVEAEDLTLNDGQSGVNVPAVTVNQSFTEQYNATLRSVDPYNLGILLGAGALASITQAATPKADIKHYAHPDQWFNILDADYDDAATPGKPIRMINPAESFVIDEDDTGTPGTPISAANIEVDYERGMAKISSAGLPAAAVVWLSYTPSAISGNRVMYPQTQSFSRRGRFELWLGYDNNSVRAVRSFDGEIRGTGLGLAISEFSNIQAEIKVTPDSAKTTDPAGSLFYPKGEMPTERSGAF